MLTYVSEIESYLQVPPEIVCKSGVDIEDLQKVVPQDAVQVTVGGGVDIWIAFSWLVIQVYGLSKDVVLFCESRVKDAFEGETDASIVETEYGNMVVPNMATTTSSLMTCTEPREIKKRESRMSP